MKEKAGVGCMILGTALIIAALSLFFYNRWEDNQAEKLSSQLLVQVQEAIQQDEDHLPVKSEEQEAVLDPYDTEMTVKTIDGNEYIGYLSIPDLELELPVMSDWDYSRMRIAPCRFFGSTKTNNLIIAGHNYTSHFGTLNSLATGSIVIFTDMDNVRSIYEVIEIVILSPTDVAAMIESEYDLTLFTCTVGGEYRVTVRCNRYEPDNSNHLKPTP